MALDASLMALLAKELNSALAESRLDKLHQPSRDEVLFLLRAAGPGKADVRLLISARTGGARAGITGERFENPQNPPSFCMLLRKHLLGGRLLRVTSLSGDRVLFFDFLCRSEMEDTLYNTVAAELMGRYCNIVLVRKPADLPMWELAVPDSAKKAPHIIDALKRVNFEDSSVRQLLPGLAYTLPPQAVRLDFLTAPAADIVRAAKQTEAAVAPALSRAAGGVGPVIAREAAYRALGRAAEKPAAQLTDPECAALQNAIMDIRGDYAAGGFAHLVRGQDGEPLEFSFTRLTQYLPGCRAEEYPDFSSLLDGYYAERDRIGRLKHKSKELRRTVNNLYERALRRQAARTEDLAACENSGILRIKGELLCANMHLFKKGDAKVMLQNWADGAQVEITLDPRYTQSQNAQKYFKEYKRKQTASKKLVQLMRQGAQEIEYLASVIYELDSASGEAALAEIRAELQSQGYLHPPKRQDKRHKPADFLRYRSEDGFLILVGRNNAQNEKLTVKTARGRDVWCHVKNAPGSHVVVISEGRVPPYSTVNQAAMLAVWHSGQKNGAKVPVDYTEVKNIRKPAGLPPGMVLYERYETALITPSREALPPVESPDCGGAGEAGR